MWEAWICSICQFTWCKDSYHSQFQASNVLSSDLLNSWKCNQWFSRASTSQVQHTPDFGFSVNRNFVFNDTSRVNPKIIIVFFLPSNLLASCNIVFPKVSSTLVCGERVRAGTWNSLTLTHSVGKAFPLCFSLNPPHYVKSKVSGVLMCFHTSRTLFSLFNKEGASLRFKSSGRQWYNVIKLFLFILLPMFSFFLWQIILTFLHWWK